MKFVARKTNVILFILAIAFTIAGYIVMSTGDKTISPVLLILAYVILFPAAIMVGVNKKNGR